MRIAVLIEDRCKPNSPAFMYLQKYAGTCGGECIQVNGNKCKILESACPPCLVRAKHCPGDAVKIINLPEELDTDLTHRYGENGFRLFRLPAPKKLEVVGILGANGMGKSTAINLLSGTLRPNLGDWLAGDLPWEEVLEAFPRGELRDFMTNVAENGVRIAVKPQYVDKIPKAFDGKVSALLERIDQRGVIEQVSHDLGIDHLFSQLF